MITHVLDSSAFIAYFFDEAGSERVADLFAQPQFGIGLSVLSQVEFWSRMRHEGFEDSFPQEWNEKAGLFESIIPVTLSVSRRAIDLRSATACRLPTVDALIAATASLYDAVLVHRDSHFASIPENLLKQESLSEK